MLIVWGSFKKTSNLALDNLFHQSVLTRFISEKICLTFAFVEVTVDIISNIGRMFLHSSLRVLLVNTLDHIVRYFTHLLFFTSCSIWVFKVIHSGMMLSTSQMFLDNNSWNEMIFLSQPYHQSYRYLYLLAKILCPVKLQYF